MRRLTVFLFAMLIAVVAFAQTPIYDIQYVDDPVADDASPMVGETVTIQGYVTFEPMSYGGSSFYVADAAGPWNGVNVYTGDQEYNLGWGWEVEVTGVVEEYYGKTEVVADEPGQVTVVNAPYALDFWSAVPAHMDYTVVAPGDLSDPATAEQYEGVLVRVEDVTPASLPDDYGEWSVTDGVGTAAVDNPSDDVYGYKHYVLENQPYVRVEGVLEYTFSEYKILPEIAYNLEVNASHASGFYDQIAYFQQVRPMDMTIRVYDNNNYTWDHSYASRVRYGLDQGGDDGYGEDVVIHALITYPTALGYAGDGAKFIMTDWLVGDTQEPWMSVLSYTPDPDALGELYEGDEIVFYGEAGEYQTGPSNMTELWITDPYEFLSAGHPLPDPALVTIEDFRVPMLAEQWGNVFVELNDVVVTDTEPTPYELFTVDDDLDDAFGSVKIDDDSEAMTDYPDPALGANITEISGWVYHHFGVLDTDVDNLDWVYKICPSYPEDIVIGEAPPNILACTRDNGTPGANTLVTINATIADNSMVESATIYYRVDGGAWQESVMEHQVDLEWEGEIEGQAAGTFIEYYVEATDDIGSSSTAPANTAMGYFGYWAMDEPGLYEVSYSPWQNGNSPYNGYVVTVTGVITNSSASAIYYADATHGPAYFLQSNVANDPEYTGLTVHLTPDLGDLPEIGDEITATGTINESGDSWSFKWGNNTRMIGTAVMTINSSGNTPVVYDQLFVNVNAEKEAYESVLMSFNDLHVTSVNQYDWTISDGTGTFLLDDDIVPADDSDTHDLFASLGVGTTIQSITGIVTYSFGTWKIEVRDLDDFTNVGVDEEMASAQPLEFSLAPVYPNPFNPTANINFTLPANGDVQLIVYNTMGQQVRTLIDSQMRAGVHSAFWDGRSNAGQPVTSGTYFLRLISGQQQQVQKMVLMK